nr:protein DETOXIFICATION 14-like [Ipomoea batatas]
MEEEEPLLLEENMEEEAAVLNRKAFVGEVKEVNRIALPMIVVTVSQYLLRTSPMLMLGHLGELPLSSASIATSLCNVTGYSVLRVWRHCAGRHTEQDSFKKLSTFTYVAILCLFLVCIPVSILWLFTERLLKLIGQDPSIAAQAGNYAIWLIPTLFPYAILQSLVRYLQTQSLILPMLWTAVAALCLQLPICWAFIFKLNLGNAGAALSIGVSYWFNVILILVYVKYSSTCKKSRATLSWDVFATMGEFFRFALPSAVMVCLTTTSVHYHIPYSFGAAASVRVSNALGGGKPQAARAALFAVLLLSATEFLLASVAIFCCRYVWGYMFTYEQEVITYVKEITPLLCLSIILDGTQAVLSGVARGSGWQHIGAYVNLGSYYLFGIPLALLFGFVLHLKGEGLWGGLVAGGFLQSTVFSLITGFTDWESRFVYIFIPIIYLLSFSMPTFQE